MIEPDATCDCGHDKDIHFQDGCLSKAGGGYFCECMEFQDPTPCILLPWRNETVLIRKAEL